MLKQSIRKWLGLDEVVTSQPTIQYKIVEVEVPRTPLQGVDSEEMRASIATLPSHPGFQYLIKKLALQHAQLRSKMDFERHTDLREVDFLQSGLYWSAWLDNEVKRTTVKYTAQRIDPMADELQAFQEIDSQIERVGMDA